MKPKFNTGTDIISLTSHAFGTQRKGKRQFVLVISSLKTTASCKMMLQDTLLPLSTI